MLKRLLAVALIATALTVLPSAASASAAARADECVVHVLRTKASGEMVLSEPRCYGSHAEAMEREGVSEWGTGASERAAVTAASFTIGYHCDGYNLGGPCTSVVGTGCTGGWLNTSATWNNRISSTQNGCPTIRHYNGANLTGAWVATSGVGSWTNLTTFNNLTSSLQYL